MSMLSSGVNQLGWFGSRPLTANELSSYFVSYHSDYTAGTNTLIGKYADLGIERQYAYPLHRMIGSGKLFLNHVSNVSMSSVDTNSDITNESCSRFSIITLYYKHYEYFKECAESVRTLFNKSLEDKSIKFEWVIINDDPSFTREQISAAIPNDIAPFVSIISDGNNEGISSRTNQACNLAVYENIVFLDCDDLINDDAFVVLRYYFKQFSSVRYVSSACLDIDERGNIVRQRFHAHPSTEMFERGMLAGHLKCIKRSLFNELGGFDGQFSGVQDYDFALRTLLQESILLIPEALYRYRWHPNTQSLSREIRQASNAEKVRKNALSLLVSWKPEPCQVKWSSDDKGVCIIRTIGSDINLLLEAVDSALENGLFACVVSHTNNDDYEFIKGRVQRDNTVVLHAPDRHKKRGHPMNVALDYIQNHERQYEYFCFLDDDDYLLPNFSKDLLAVAVNARSDVVYGLSNSVSVDGKRVCQHAPCPSIALLGGNFIPIGSYIVNMKSFQKHNIRFAEDIHYLEDWDFLIKILQSGLKFAPYFKAVAEYRLIGDGNTNDRSRPEEFLFCSHIVRASSARASLSFDIIDFWREACYFPDMETYRISAVGMDAIDAAKKILIQRAELSL